MLRRLAALIAVAAAALFASAVTASAAYTPTTSTGTVSSTTVALGGTVNFCGSGFAAGSTIDIALDDVAVGSDTADGAGKFCFQVEIDTAGTHVLSATGVNALGGTHVVTATVLGVTASAGGSALPRTGSDLGTQLWIGAGLLALGGGLVALSVARRRETAIA